MNSIIFKNNIEELEARINALKLKNSELQTSNQLLSKKAEWLETELVMSKHYCALLKNSALPQQMWTVLNHRNPSSIKESSMQHTPQYPRICVETGCLRRIFHNIYA